ncbi:cupin domain-containing protein [Chitiniphilus eburneus]|uniref:Cupin domain-containing protein n=1 Tax=Chitiniphilus eburneus TaxID=2571148 RepID=A0A4U0Q3E2_9NEIS|nr:cupin domain-containing protein [Chitiniphilus eburneus]TJZ75499.1 cupin domain-containing protein [Chitiniphilus eburneus]
MSVVDLQNAEHYRWGEACDGWHLLRTPELSVIRERMPPGTAETRHVHHISRQFFQVLAGTLQIELDQRLHAVTAGQGLEVPPGVAHQVRNTGDQDAQFIVISQPPSHTDRHTAPQEANA